MKIINRIVLVVMAAVALMMGASCSTTRKIPQGDLLYIGTKVEMAKDQHIPAALTSAITTAVDVPPNNYISLIGMRSPFPIGLWAYNNWPNPPKGFRHWLYEKFAEEPVLVADVRPEARAEMIRQILNNAGYFRGSASYSLVHPRNRRKAKVVYNVVPGPAFPIDSLFLLPDTTVLNHLIDSIAMRDRYLSASSPRFSMDSLQAARTRISDALRNRGYYYFQPDFIEYLADTIENRGQVALKMVLAPNVPRFVKEPYRVGDVTVVLNRNQGGGIPDTVKMNRATLIRFNPSRFRNQLINEDVTFRPGRVFSVRDVNRTQNYMTRLGIFRSVDVDVTPDTLHRSERKLNVLVDATFDTPLETSLEVNVSSKSNSYVGPGLTFGVTNKNIFGGGEQFSVKLSGSYEWQTGRGRHRSLFNSYEVGLTGSLAFPRLLVPKFIPRSRYQLNWTRISLNVDVLNRPHYFKMAQFNGSITYDWRVRRHVQNTFTPFKLTYTKLMNTTHDFDSIMAANPAVAQSFKSQFIPQMAYTYVYDRAINPDNSINWQFTLQEAGNVFWAIYTACGQKGEKKLFGTPFSQFVKGQTQFVWNRRIGRGDNWIVSRIAVGAAHAYGNSTQVPYAEQFYVGGANSVRAFTVRSIGPGSYRPPEGQPEDYFDRTGTFKFEANVEYRFPIWSILHGAVFLDSGNVWLLKSDALRPGGTLRASSFFRDLALGTGAGLRVDISMLVVRADLGVGIHAPYNTGKRGYYNMTSFGKSLAFHVAIGYPF